MHRVIRIDTCMKVILLSDEAAKDLLGKKITVFIGQKLCNLNFSNEKLINFSFNNSILKRCNFSNCDLSHASFIGADLYRCRFDNSILYDTNFKDADLTRANFEDAKMYGTRMFGADLTRTVFDDIIHEEKVARTKEDFVKAAEVYTHLNFCLKNNGLTTPASSYYLRSKICGGKSIDNPIKRTLDNIVFGYMLGYGERLSNILVSAGCIIILFSFIYCLLPIFGSISGLYYDKRILLVNCNDLFYSFYYTILTFVAYTPNNPEPMGNAQIVSLVETIVGVSYMAVALTVLIKKIIRE